jgi:hypothetical protein
VHDCSRPDPVGVAVAPDDYKERLKPLFPSVWKNIALYAMEAHDLALARLQRNADQNITLSIHSRALPADSRAAAKICNSSPQNIGVASKNRAQEDVGVRSECNLFIFRIV